MTSPLTRPFPPLSSSSSPKPAAATRFQARTRTSGRIEPDTGASLTATQHKQTNKARQDKHPCASYPPADAIMRGLPPAHGDPTAKISCHATTAEECDAGPRTQDIKAVEYRSATHHDDSTTTVHRAIDRSIPQYMILRHRCIYQQEQTFLHRPLSCLSAPSPSIARCQKSFALKPSADIQHPPPPLLTPLYHHPSRLDIF